MTLCIRCGKHPRSERRLICMPCKSADVRAWRLKWRETNPPKPRGRKKGSVPFASKILPEQYPEILHRIANGETTEAVAANLKVSPATIRRIRRMSGAVKTASDCSAITDAAFYREFNPMMGRWASMPIRVSL